MAPRRLIETLLLNMFIVMAHSQSQSDPSSYCTTVLISLSPCLDYITGKASTPSSSCCSQLEFVVTSQPQCLCEVVSGCTSCVAASLNINQTLALSLPSVCNIQTPPISSCTGSASPTGISVSNTPNFPSGIGSNSVWSMTGGGRSIGSSYHENSSSTKLPSTLLILFLFATFTFLTIT